MTTAVEASKLANLRAFEPPEPEKAGNKPRTYRYQSPRVVTAVGALSKLANPGTFAVPERKKIRAHAVYQ